jgi:hypothetical protein
MKNEKPEVRTILNHAFVYRTDSETMEKIREFLLELGATLIYEKHSFGKLFIKSEEEERKP